MKVYAILLSCLVYAQDDTTTAKEETTSTAAATTTTPEKTTATPTVKCIVCKGKNSEKESENLDCFDGVGEEKDFGEVGECITAYHMIERDGETSYIIERKGNKTRSQGDEKYPMKHTQATWSQVCTDSECNDHDGKTFFGAKSLVQEGKYFFGDDETTTVAVTTTAATTTVAPDFSCYMCAAESTNGSYADIAGCGSMGEDASLEVCGSEGIGSCITQFMREENESDGINSMNVMRGCNAKADNSTDSLMETNIVVNLCIESNCNNEKYESSALMISSLTSLLLCLILQ